MNEIESMLDALANLLNRVNGLPAAGIVLLSCWVVGYALRFWKKFPNEGIPVAVILWGGAFNPLLADLNSQMGWRIWFVKNLLVGLVIGFLAWLVHNLVLAKLEDWLTSKVPALPVLRDKPPQPIPQPDDKA